MNDQQSDYEKLVRPIEERMMRTVWRIVRDPDEAQDAFQQATETIWKRWSRVRRHPNPPALVMTICIHAAYDRLRQRSRRARREVSDQHLEFHTCPEPLVDELLVASETQEAIHSAIAMLPPMQQATVSLRLLANLSFDAIAEALGCSEVTARTNCLQALKKLRGQLADHNPETWREANS
jgi:RNA polymerase sigma factor (sigma-70 family)